LNNQANLVIDIGTSTIDAVIATQKQNGHISVLGTGTVKTEGLDRGTITNIDQLGSSIKKAVQSAKRTSDEMITAATVSIPGSYTKTIRSTGSIIIPNGFITEREIKKVLETAYHNGSTIPEYEVIHVLPIYFKVDDVQSDSPINMTGSTLEASVSIVIAKKSALVNIANALKPSNLDVENFVLSGYASCLSTLQEDERRFGSLVLDLGASNADITLYHGKSILFSDFIPIGSQYLTSDISQTFNTPLITAEMVKNQYATLHAIEEHALNQRIQVPIIGNEEETSEIGLNALQSVVHARVEEMLVLLKEKVIETNLLEKVRAGIVLTGGFSKLPGIKELAEKVFDDTKVKIATVKNIQNEYVDFQDNSKSTVVGLIYYALNTSTTYELDSKKQLKSIYQEEEVQEIAETYNEIKLDQTQIPTIVETNEQESIQQEQVQNSTQQQSSQNINNTQDPQGPQLVPIDKQKKSGVSKVIQSIKEWF
jgi:cell division protein FtsA